jgi:hypothetical protein
MSDKVCVRFTQNVAGPNNQHLNGHVGSVKTLTREDADKLVAMKAAEIIGPAAEPQPTPMQRLQADVEELKKAAKR